MHRPIRAVLPVLALGATVLLGACERLLPVENSRTPDITNVLKTPPLVESYVSKLYQQMHNGVYTTTSVLPAAMTMAFESASSLNNFNMGPRSSIPRNGLDNNIGNSAESEQLRIFDQMQRNGRQAVNAILRFDTLMAQAGSTGALQDPKRDARVKSVAFFALGYSLGTVAVWYDSAAIVTPAVVLADPFSPIPLSGAKEVTNAALQMLDSALVYADQSGMSIPAAWFASTSGDFSAARWKQIIHSHKARFRASVARTPEERAAVDWQAVVNDATQGMQQNLTVLLDPTTGWNHSWIIQSQVDAGWSQMSPFILGMADTTGAYAAWLGTTISARAPFLIRTPDRRFPAGDDRAAQQASSGSSRIRPSGSRIYIRNRPSGEDLVGFAFGNSYYDHIRYADIRLNTSVGPFDDMTAAESDLLAAEGYLRLGKFPEAAALIDKTRVPNGLPSVAGINDLTTPVPGGNACVPRVPSAAAPTTLTCGNIFEAMKWEKRMETQFNGYGSWFVDSRGWGDLVAATPLEWPVPYQEYNSARGKPTYSKVRVAPATNTYGF